MRALAGVLLLALSLGSWAQEDEGLRGTVVGNVVCADTQKPARLAQVWLVHVPGAENEGGPAGLRRLLDDPGFANTYGRLMVYAGLDGSFHLSQVPAGEYYVFATRKGYLSPMQIVLATAADATPQSLETAFPKVLVAPGHTVRADVRLEHGGAISGKAMFDDGSPAYASVFAEAVHETSLQQQFRNVEGGLNSLMGDTRKRASGVTDDRGLYRLTGLPPGEYVVWLRLVGGGISSIQDDGSHGLEQLPVKMTVYAPGVFHRRLGQVVKVGLGEEQEGVDITVDQRGVRTVSGHVASATDGHVPSYGKVELIDAGDGEGQGSLELSSPVDREGNFLLRAVPPGKYVLSIDAEDTDPKAWTKTLRRYDSPEMTIVVDASDVTGLQIGLKETKRK